MHAIRNFVECQPIFGPVFPNKTSLTFPDPPGHILRREGLSTQAQHPI